MSDGGKGDKTRPLNIPLEVFEENFENIDWNKRADEKDDVEEQARVV